MPNDFKLDFKFKTCFVETISDANIQNCVKKITGRTNSGVTAKNLINPGEWAYPTDIKIFLKGVLLFLSGKILTPKTKINIDQINQVKIAVRPDKPTEVLIIVLAATAPATPSKIIIRPAKYIAASPKYLFSLYSDLSNFKDLKKIFRNSASIYKIFFFIL